MTHWHRRELKQFEGHRVNLALADGSRIDDCELVAVDGGRRGHLWVHANGPTPSSPSRRSLTCGRPLVPEQPLPLEEGQELVRLYLSAWTERRSAARRRLLER